MRHITITLVLLLCAFNLNAQRTVHVHATYKYVVPDNKSLDEAKRIALDRAKIKAIADEFGTIVTQNNSTVIRKHNEQSTIDFMSLGGSDVKGEWIETTKEPSYNITTDGDLLMINVEVDGIIKETTAADIDITATTLRNGIDLKYESTTFRNGDNIYLYIKSPLDGFLTVYLLDENTMDVYCCLPYKDSPLSSEHIEHDKEYIFFSQEKSKTPADEYALTASHEIEYNTLYIIFSTEKFNKATATQADATKPNNLTYEDFKKYTSKLRKWGKNIMVKEIKLEIRR